MHWRQSNPELAPCASRPRERVRVLAVAIAMRALALAGARAGSAEQVQPLQHQLQDKRASIGAASRRERELGAAIALQSETIDGLQSQVGGLGAQVISLERKLAVERSRLDELGRELDEERATLLRLRGESRKAQRFLERRLVEIYVSDQPSAAEVILGAGSLDEMLAQLDSQQQLLAGDERLIALLDRTRTRTAIAAEKTQRLRAEQARKTALVRRQTDERRSALRALLARRDALITLQAERRRLLASVQVQEKQWLSEASALQAQTRRISALALASSSTNPVPPTSALAPASGGLIWPVRGSLVSPFGLRWGRLHAGIDIAAPAGTPIAASGSGSLTYAGEMSGYGLLVVVQHEGGIATAYAHNSSVSVSVGQQVSQGQMIAAAGCTGHCFGDHVHFEVRVNGQAVDPMGYL